MATVSFPTFADKEILTAEKLNAWVQSLESKFTSGFNASDIQWPLLAEGDLNMGTGSSGYSILGGKKIMNIVHAGGYDSLADAVAAAGAGGVVLIPPDTTITTGGGITFVGSGVAIIGCGPSSVVQFTASPTSGYMFRTDVGGVSGLMFSNLTLDGNTGAGSAQAGVIVRGASDVFFQNVIFDDFSGIALQLTNDGGSNRCQRVYVDNCIFKTGDDHHIQGDDVQDLHIKNCVSIDCPEQAIELAAAGTQYMSRVAITDCVIDNCAKESIYVAGANGTGASYWGDVTIRGCKIEGQDAEDAIVAGTVTGKLQRVSISECVYAGATGAPADGISMNVDEGVVSDCNFGDCTSDGVDMGSSRYVTVQGNVLRNAGAYGVLTASTSDCRVINNDLDGATTQGIQFGGTDLRHYGNKGQTGSLPGNILHLDVYNTTFGTTVETAMASFTVPAGQLEVGDEIMYQVHTNKTNANDTATVRVRIGSVSGTIVGQQIYSSAGAQAAMMVAHVYIVSDTTGLLWYGNMHNAPTGGYPGGGSEFPFDRTSANTFIATSYVANTTDYVTLNVFSAKVVGHKEQ
ncbi:MAG: hypothetical protein AMJ55_00405 [Gammaproteobacteria bacterium SG8_15]|nr:MAG: hypothetical protein AMJ55_00405 [Gammaproteobacteria bacterium SG8_15]